MIAADFDNDGNQNVYAVTGERLSPNDAFGDRKFLTPRRTKAGQEGKNLGWDPDLESHHAVK